MQFFDWYYHMSTLMLVFLLHDKIDKRHIENRRADGVRRKPSVVSTHPGGGVNVSGEPPEF